MQLRNGDKAVIDERKLWGYPLNPGHPHGSEHATLFKHLLGIDLSNWRLLSAELARAARFEDATIGKTSSYGEKYEIRFPMTGPRGRIQSSAYGSFRMAAKFRSW